MLTKLRKMTISFVMYVRPPVRPSVPMEQLGYHWTDFKEIHYLIICLKSVEGILVGFLALEDGTDRLF